VLAAVAWPVWDGLDAALGRSVSAQIVSLGVALAAGGAAYLLACKALRVRELETLLALRSRSTRA
jgi:putative peptidoglycan lipid II flippase